MREAWGPVAVWAVRHGQSTANAAFAEAERTGSTAVPTGLDRDVPLSELGVAQARGLGRWFAREDGPVDLVVCSRGDGGPERFRLAVAALGRGGARRGCVRWGVGAVPLG
ncbi:phosphoglycerate mutase family protein (plasmid) [Streptomyces sp. BI20]|uniref:phosphoglycerate mutase family protein n=1 Tax=Streptomyces sp. BI20 TaxID=3403460 RepID=UPI003C7928A9